VQVSFFKFVTQDRIDILINGQIRFTPVSDFNDPFEFKPVVTPLHRKYLNMKNELDNLGNKLFLEKYPNFWYRGSEKLHDDYSFERVKLRKKYGQKLDTILSEYGVLSLHYSEHAVFCPSMHVHNELEPRQNILMWSHYAHNHTGLLIEFDQSIFDDVIFTAKYESERPLITYEEIDNLTEESLATIFCCKKDSWVYENERRFIKKLSDANELKGNNCHLFNFNKKHIKSVVVGCNATDDFQKKVFNLLCDDPELKHVRFYFSKLDKDSFKLNFFSRMERNGSRGWSNSFNGEEIVVNIPQQIHPDYFDF